MNNLDSFIDFGEFGDFQQFPNADSTSLAISRKNYSPSQPYIFKIFNFTCYSSKNQKIILNTFYQTSNHKLQYLKSYTRLSFSFQSQLTPTFSMKYFTSKTLSDVLSTPSLLEALNFENILDCLFAVSEGMLYLHNHLIYHGNLCPSNIVIDQAEQFYLCDFGLYPIKKLYLNESQMFNREYKDPYMSSNEPTFKNDVYSFGVLMCDLLLSYIQSGNNGSNGKSRQMRLQEIIIGNARENDNATKHQTLMEFIRNPSRSKFDIFPPFFSELVALCMNSFVSERPSFKQIVERFKSSNETVFGMNIQQMYNKFINSNYILNLASIGDSYALNKVGSMYEQGKVFEKNNQLAMKYYKQAADLRNSKAQNKIGLLLQKNAGTLNEGAHYLRLSAEQGNIQGMANYGIALLYGRGVEKNIQKAVEYLKKSADLGCSYAQVNYGYTLLNNNPTIYGANEGLSYIKQAMNQNSPDAYYTYGVLLQNGQFVEQDDKLAMENFKIAADMGFDKAIIEYAEGNMDGKGVPKNDKIALEYYVKAYEKGNEEVKDIIDTLRENEYQNRKPPKTSTKAQPRKALIKLKPAYSDDSSQDNLFNFQDNPAKPIIKQRFDMSILSSSTLSAGVADIKPVSEPKPKLLQKTLSLKSLEKPPTTTTTNNSQQATREDSRLAKSKSEPKIKFDMSILDLKSSSSNVAKENPSTPKSESKFKFDMSILSSPSSSSNNSQEISVKDDDSSALADQTQSADKIKLPSRVSPKIVLNSLGEIVYDRVNYHNENYIYPVGYQVEKEYYSIADPSKQTIYRSTVLDGGESPIFKVECLDSTGSSFEGNNPSKPWRDIMNAIEDTKRQLGLQTKNVGSVSGPCAFGFPLRNVTNMIEELPNADKCINYKFKNYNGANRHSQVADNDKLKELNQNKNEQQVPISIQSFNIPSVENIATSNQSQLVQNVAPTPNNISKSMQNVAPDNVQQQQKQNVSAIDGLQQASNVSVNNQQQPVQNVALNNQKNDLNRPTEELVKLGDAFLSQGNQKKAFECYEECYKRGNADVFTNNSLEYLLPIEKLLDYYELGIEKQISLFFSKWRRTIMEQAFQNQNMNKRPDLARRFEKYDDFSDAAYIYFTMKDQINFQICYEKAKKNIDDIKEGIQQFYFGILNREIKEYKLAKLMLTKSLQNGVQQADQIIQNLPQDQSQNNNRTQADYLLEEGINYFDGRGDHPINVDRAIDLFKQASALGCPKADYYLGSYYRNCDGAKHLENSAKMGDPDGMNLYAFNLMNGFLTNKDPEKAMEYFKKAADKGHAEAAYEYGRRKYQFGTTENDKNEGISYLKMSAEKMFPDALYVYSKVIKDTNPYDSKKFYDFSIEKGSQLAMNEQEKNYEENVQETGNNNQVINNSFYQLNNVKEEEKPSFQSNRVKEEPSFQSNRVKEEPSFQLNRVKEEPAFQLNRVKEEPAFQESKFKEETIVSNQEIKDENKVKTSKPKPRFWKKVEEATISHKLLHEGVPLTGDGEFDWSRFRELCGFTKKTDEQVEKYVTDLLNTSGLNDKEENERDSGGVNNDEEKKEETNISQKTINKIKQCFQTLAGLRRAFIKFKEEELIEYINSVKIWKISPLWTSNHELFFFKQICDRGWGVYKDILSLPEFNGVFEGDVSKALTQDSKVISHINKFLDYIENKTQEDLRSKDLIIPENLSKIVKYDSDGSLIYPIKLTESLSLLNLGQIVNDRPGFRTESYIYPAGFKSSRLYNSVLDPPRRVRYINEIVDTGDKSPLFTVTMEGHPEIRFQGTTPSGPWSNLIDAVKERLKEPNNNKKTSVCGPNRFGLNCAITAYLIQQMPGAKTAH
ncbi:choline dehydrogenase 6 [Tritrichomonas musculus]|uniref:Choline dehydrogenase 6 n=1 Tax=Tritrichomonas musculus TaxID=1915356 RepID=A0ABR2GU44_9EUKA